MAFVSSYTLHPRTYTQTHTHTHIQTHINGTYRPPLAAQQCHLATCVASSENSVSKEYGRYSKAGLQAQCLPATRATTAIRDLEMFLYTFPVNINTVLDFSKWLCVYLIQSDRNQWFCPFTEFSNAHGLTTYKIKEKNSRVRHVYKLYSTKKVMSTNPAHTTTTTHFRTLK